MPELCQQEQRSRGLTGSASGNDTACPMVRAQCEGECDVYAGTGDDRTDTARRLPSWPISV